MEMAVLGRCFLVKDFVCLSEMTCDLHEAGHREHDTAAALLHDSTVRPATVSPASADNVSTF